MRAVPFDARPAAATSSRWPLHLLLVPMALTSTRRAQRALGWRSKMLHRASYAVALLAALHYFMLTKVDLTQPLLHAAAELGLLGWRVFAARRRSSEL